MMFAALSGSSPPRWWPLGTIAIAGMRQVGYSKRVCLGHRGQRGHLGHFDSSIHCHGGVRRLGGRIGGAHVLAGVVPGLIAGAMLMLAIYIVARVKVLRQTVARHGRGVNRRQRRL